MPRKLILSVGLHKTGTTSIQQTCAQNRGPLDAAGMYFPLLRTTMGSAEILDANHSRLLRRMFRQRLNTGIGASLAGSPNRLQSETRALFEKTTGHVGDRTLLLTAEAVSNFDPDELRELKDWFASRHFSTRVLLCVRQPSSWLNSMVAQRSAGPTSPRLTIEAAVSEIADSATVYRRKVLNILEVFPDAEVYAFQSAVAHRHGPAGWFLEKAGIRPASMSDWKIVKGNERLSDHGVRLNSKINHAVGYRLQSKAALSFFNSLSGRYGSLFEVPGEKFHLRHAEAMPLLPILIEENEWLMKTFGDGYYDKEVGFSNERVELDTLTRQFLIDNFRNAESPVKEIVQQYIAEH